MHRRFSRHAFTLIELLVVISIIAILIALLLPALSKAKSSADSAACLTIVRQMSAGHYAYAVDHDGASFQHKSSPTTTGHDPENFWFGQMIIYTANSENIVPCPVATDTRETGTSFPGFGSATHAWGRPGVWTDYWIGDTVNSYMINAWMYDIRESPWLPGGRPVSNFYQNIDAVDKTSNTPVFIDGAWAEGWPEDTDDTNGNIQDPYNPWLGIEMSRCTLNRHPARTVNATMVDGSARAVVLEDLWKLNWHENFDTSVQTPDLPYK